MNVEDKARYGRALFLVLYTCRVALRHVIVHYFTTNGFSGFANLLDQPKNKDLLFHLRFQTCCLVNCTSRSTPITLRSQQWDLLYRETSHRNPHGDRGKCPCMYTAIPGVTADVLDVTLCCVLLRNICRAGINISYVEDICTVRNQLLHANSATLDEQSFNYLWKKVETAILSLASSISVTCHDEMVKSIQETRNGVFNLTNLDSLLAIERRIRSLEETQERETQKNEEYEKRTQTVEEEHLKSKEIMSKLEADNGNILKRMISLELCSSCTNQKMRKIETETKEIKTENKNTKRRVTTLERKMTHMKKIADKSRRHQRSYSKTESHVTRKEDERKEKVLKALLKINNRSSEKIQISPLHNNYKTFDQVYAFPVITEISEDDVKERLSDNNKESEKRGKKIKCPQDMFYKNGEHVRYLFLKGGAGCGKTVCMKQLLRHWCRAKEAARGKEGLNDWERGMDEFDFVFMIMLRHVQKSISLLDMIVRDLFKHFHSIRKDVAHVISSDKYHCLIIIDGLDEWKISPEIRKNLAHEALPNIAGTSCCTFLFTYRPWKHSEIAGEIESCDRVIQIHGFDEKGMGTVIENVLEGFHKKDSDRKALEKERDEIIKMSKRSGLTSFLQIPLLVSSFVIMYHEGEYDENSMTGFYLALVQLLIKRAKKKSDEGLKLELSDQNILKKNMPDICILKSSRYKTFLEYLSLLTKLGDIAYNDLMSTETCLVFSKEELEEKLGKAELEFTLQVGLLSQCEAPGCFDQENVSLNFFHKTIQELLAAAHIVCSGEVSVQTFCEQLSSVKAILDCSNVVSFVSGLSPTFGCSISRQIVHVSNQDDEIQDSRELFSSECYLHSLVKLQYKCYMEIKQNHKKLDMQDNSFQVANILESAFLCQQEILKILRDSAVDTVALSVYYNWEVHPDGDKILVDFLLRTKLLQYLKIYGSTRNANLLGCISTCLRLRIVELCHVNVTKKFMDGLAMSVKFSGQLQTLKLHGIKMISSQVTNQDETFGALEDLLRTLPDCHHLSTLHFACGSFVGTPDRDALLNVLPYLKELVDVQVIGDSRDNFNTAVLEGISQLPQLRHLQLIDIDLNERFTELISKRSKLQSLYLECLKIENRCMYHISQMSQLQDLHLTDITISDGDCDVKFKLPMLEELQIEEFKNAVSIELMSECKEITFVRFWSVDMPVDGWRRFLTSLLEHSHKIEVRLHSVNIDDESMRMITQCPQRRLKKVYQRYRDDGDYGDDGDYWDFEFQISVDVANDTNQ